jgi:hypothetical protein
MRIENPHEAFRVVFTQSCDMSERDLATFVNLAGASRRASEHAERLITGLAVTADNRESRATATEILLAGVTRPGGPHGVRRW